MRRIVFAFLAMVAAPLIVSAQQINDENAVVREAKNFHAINLSSAFTVYLSQGSDEAVAVSASEPKYRDRIKVEVKDGVLYIGFNNELHWGGKMKLKAYISFKQLDKLVVSGACDVYTSGSIHADDLEIKLSGASNLKTVLDVARLTVNLNGASDFTVSGKASRLTIDANGASDFKGFDLVTETCNATASGASDIKITVNGEISARLSGASDLRYKGEGVIKELKNSGASSVSKG